MYCYDCDAHMFEQTYGPSERGGYSREYRCGICGYTQRNFDFVEDAADFHSTYPGTDWERGDYVVVVNQGRGRDEKKETMEFKIIVSEEGGRRYGVLEIPSFDRFPNGKKIKKPLGRSGDPGHQYRLTKIFPISADSMSFGTLVLVSEEELLGLILLVGLAQPGDELVFQGEIIG